MVKKLKALAGGAATEGEFAQTVRESARNRRQPAVDQD